MLQRVNGRHGKAGHNSYGRGRALYRSYVFKDKDPIIDRVRTILADEGVEEKQVSALSGVSRTTLTNWFEGETKKPQFATIAAVAMAMGYVTDLVKKKRVNYDKEYEKAAAEIVAAKQREKRRLRAGA